MEEEKQEAEPTPETTPTPEPTTPTPAPEPEQGEVQIEKGKVTDEQLKEVESSDFVTISQLANKLHFSKFWIWELVTKGRIKAIKPLGGQWRIPRSEYERLLKEGIPPMPRKPIEKPAVTEIVVDEEKVVSRVKEPKEPEEKPQKQFG